MQQDWDTLFTVFKQHLNINSLPSVNQLAENNPFKALFSTIISLRTKDKVTTEASLRLFSKYQTPEQLAVADSDEIAECIFPAGFYRTKAVRMKEIAGILVNKYNGNVPSKLEELLELPGVGLKTANLTLGVGFGIYAICVDIHVHRISNRLGLIKTDTPDESEKELRAILPKQYWISINMLMVNFGQKICTPASPWCSKCALSESCPRRGVTKSR